MIRKSTLLGICSIIGISALFTSCETDVDLTAPYKTTPVITAVLDYTADTQFVRINRTYLTDSDVNASALNRDSVEYKPEEVEAWIIKKLRGERLDSIQLEHIVLPSRDPGVFYDEDVSFWYTADPIFTEDEIDDLGLTGSSRKPYMYEIIVTARGEKYVGETDFPSMRQSTIVVPFNENPPRKEKFYGEIAGVGNYLTVTWSYKQARPTGRYQNVLRMNFDYETSDGELVENQYIDYQLGIQEVNVTNPPTDRTTIEFNSENWYEFIGGKLIELPGIETVKIRDLEYRLTGANDIVNSYINVTNPISDFTPVLSTFTNFNNGAIGIIGSKALVSVTIWLEDPSLKIMNDGEYSYGLTYCVQNWSGSNYVCP